MKAIAAANDAKRSVSVTSLQGLSEYIGQFNNNEEFSESDRKTASIGEFRNATNHIVSLVAYLIGVDRVLFAEENAPYKADIYARCEAVKEYRIIRNLCRIRTAFERSYMPSPVPLPRISKTSAPCPS